MKKILLVANAKYTITQFRGELLLELEKRGCVVTIVAPLGRDLDGTIVSDKEVRPIRLDRQGISPKKDLKLFWDLVKVMREEKPDIVMNYTIKPVIYGSIAAALFSKAQIFSNMTGLGYVFTDESVRAGVLKKIVMFMYRLAFSFNTKVFFQNPDDANLFIQLGLVSEAKVKQIKGSGINLERFSVFRSKEKIPQSFLFVGRLLRDKGIVELIRAFGKVKNKFPHANLTIIGEADNNPNSFSEADIDIWKQENPKISFLGRVNFVGEALSRHQVMILPSYREGTPRSVLEGMAAGMPVITTDAPGCRETVVDGQTGFLVPVKDDKMLAEKMIYFLENPEQVSVMGDASLKLAKEKFDVRSVNEEILKTLGL